MEATQKFKNKKKSSSSNTSKNDRISFLPEALLLHILSFLDMREVLQTSLVSTKWRNLWKISPVLNFDYKLWKTSSKKKSNTRRYAKKDNMKDPCTAFADRVLLFRDKDTNIRKLHVSSLYFPDQTRILTWLIASVKGHVKEVYLETPKGKYVFPNWLFSTEIQVFSLNACFGHKVLLPDSVCSARHLKVLELRFVCFPRGGSDGKLVLNYPLLDTLYLHDCKMESVRSLNITALRLKKLVMIEDYGNDVNCLKLCTPLLAILYLSGYTIHDYIVGDLSYLVNISIGWSDEDYSPPLIKLFQSIPNAETLRLETKCYKFKHVAKNLLESCSTIKCLEVAGNFSPDAVAGLLQSVPWVETLVLNLRGDCYHAPVSNEENCGSELSLQSECHSLKSVLAVSCWFSSGELKVIGFLLKNMASLKNLMIKFHKTTDVQDVEKRVKFRENILSLPKASSGAKIDFEKHRCLSRYSPACFSPDLHQL